MILDHCPESLSSSPCALITHDNFIENIYNETNFLFPFELVYPYFREEGSRSNPKFFPRFRFCSLVEGGGNRRGIFPFLYTERHRSRCQRLYSRLLISLVTNRTYTIPLSATFFRSYKSRCLDDEYCRNESAQMFLKVYIHRLHEKRV